MSEFAYVTFIIRNDSYLPGALVFGYALKLQNTNADLICIVSDNISEKAITSLKEIYDDVIVLDEVYVPHDRRHERQDRPFLFSRFNAFRLGTDGDLQKKYNKIIIADCDILPLQKYDSLFELNTPAGIINEKKEYCMEYNDNGIYTIPSSLEEFGTWNWHDIYKDVPHGTLIPKVITDRINSDKTNMGVNASLMLFKPTMELYNSIMEDLENIEIQKEISLYNWPEMQYITLKESGNWTNMDLKFSSFNGYPDIRYINGIHFAGLKPWNIKNKSLKSFGKFDDYQLWYYTFMKMCHENPELLKNRKLEKLYEFIEALTKEEKYKYKRFNIKHLDHFFR